MKPSFEFFAADTSSELPLVFADAGIMAGFPSPAQDYISDTIDLNRELIEHPASTFYAKVVGDSMIGEGIAEGDILVIDKSLEAEHGDLAVCCVDGEFTLKRLRIASDNRIFLMPANPSFKPIEITPETDFQVWGVVIYTIRANRRRRPGSRTW